MNKDDLEKMVKAEPFVPLRLRLTNGGSHDITHPDSIMLSDRFAVVAVGDSFIFVALQHIAEVEPLPSVRH